MQVLIDVRKYDGRKHLEWGGQQVALEPDYTVVFGPIGTVGTHHGRGLTWASPHHILGIFPTSAWYNAALSFDAEGQLVQVYCNVALPPVRTGDRLQWVDLDLDVVATPDGNARLEDEDEFHEHAVTYGYPPEVVAQAAETAQWLLEQARKGEAPFGLRTLAEATRFYGCDGEVK